MCKKIVPKLVRRVSSRSDSLSDHSAQRRRQCEPRTGVEWRVNGRKKGGKERDILLDNDETREISYWPTTKKEISHWSTATQRRLRAAGKKRMISPLVNDSFMALEFTGRKKTMAAT